jgi:hypothetical protein
MGDTIAFIKLKQFSHINQSIQHILEREFPQYALEVVDLWDVVDRSDFISIPNALNAMLEYPTKLGRRNNVWQSRWGSYFLKTSYFFKTVQAAMRQRLADPKYVFTFQTQSIFDASTPDKPHFIYTDHSLLSNLHYMNVQPKDVQVKWLEWERTVYQNASHVFTPSAIVARTIVEQYGAHPDRVSCVYAGSNIPTPDPAIAADATRYASKHILFVGVDWERKGGPELLEAFRRVLQVHPDARLTIVGCSPQITLPQCHVVGRIPPEQLNRYFQEAAVFCMPTRNEPFGIVFIEAGMHRLPVVSTNIGAVPEMVCDGLSGHLVNPGDVESLAQALIDLLNDPRKCQAFGQHSFEHMQCYYTWEHTAYLMRSHIDPHIAQAVLDVELL